MKVLRREWKTPREKSTRGPGSVYQSMTMENSWVMMMDQTDKEYEE